MEGKYKIGMNWRIETMRLFFNIAGYELKKVMCRKRTVVVLLLVLFLDAVSVFGTVIGKAVYPDGNGGEVVVSGYEDTMTDRRYGEALSGRAVDADLIMEAVEAYRKIPTDVRGYSSTWEYQQYARKYSAVYQLVSGMLNMEVGEFQGMTRAEAEKFDELRTAKREYVIENSDISEGMKEYWRECVRQSPEVLTYEYHGGYYRFFRIMYLNMVLAGAAIIILFSPVFSEEYTSGADSLILSAKHGKGLVIGAKIFVTFTVAFLWSVLLILMSVGEILLVWGGSGADASIAIIRGVFPYPITIGQGAAYYTVCLVAACLLYSAVTAMLSAFFKTPFNTVIIMAALLVAPMFLELGGAPVWVQNLYSLLPTNMMDFAEVIGDFQFDVFGAVIPRYVVMPVFAAVSSGVCAYLGYRVFRGHEIK